MSSANCPTLFNGETMSRYFATRSAACDYVAELTATYGYSMAGTPMKNVAIVDCGIGWIVILRPIPRYSVEKTAGKTSNTA